MTFTDEQFKALSVCEEHFITAVHGGWSRYPGGKNLEMVYDIYTKVTGDKPSKDFNCQRCVYVLLSSCGKLYLADKALRAKSEVKVEDLPTIEEKVAVKVKKGGRRASKK